MVLAFAACVSAGERPTSPDLRPALKDVYKDYFLIGTNALDRANFANTIQPGENSDNALVMKHFNVLTPNGNFKPNPIWGAGITGNPTFTNNDRNVREAHGRGFLITAHTLLWHNNSSMWPAGPAGGGPGTAWDYPTAKANLETYIKTVAGHYTGELQLYAWDVVNEAVKDNPENPADWRSALRTGYNPEERPARWAHAYSKGGKSWDYMYDSFLFARQSMPSILNYNDFNDSENEAKATAITWMVKEFNERYASDHPEDPRKLVEVIGTQGHFDTRLNLDAFERTVKLYLDIGVDVDLTELDAMPSIALDKYTSATNTGMILPRTEEMEEIFNDQGIYYAKLFMLLKEYAKGPGGKHHDKYKGGIHRVTWWGVTDGLWTYHAYGYLWRGFQAANGSINPGDSDPKEGYWAVVDPEGYLEELDMAPGGYATFTYGGKDYKARTWGGTNFAELDINVPAGTKTINFNSANVRLPDGFTLDSIKLDPADGAVSAGNPCHVTVYAHKSSNSKNTATYKLSLGQMAVSRYKDTSAIDSSLSYVDVRFGDGVTRFKHCKTYYGNDGTLKAFNGAEYSVVPKGERATFVVRKDDNPILTKEKFWRIAKRIETGRTYMIVSTESASQDKAYVLTNRTKPYVASVSPESLSRSPVTISGDILIPPLKNSNDTDGLDVSGLAQDNLKFFFQEMQSPGSGPYATQMGHTIQCFIHGTNVYPMIVYRGNGGGTGATATIINNQYSLISRQRNGSEGPQIADRELHRAVWFNTGIDPVTGETKMFMYSENKGKYYVLKEVETGVTPTGDGGGGNQWLSQRQAATGGFVALEADSPDAGTMVKLYVYDAEPYYGVTGVKLDLSEADIEKVGGTLALTATVSPSEAAYTSVAWTTSDPSVATVSDKGVVTAVGKGTAVITVTTEEGAFSDDCTVTVAGSKELCDIGCNAAAFFALAIMAVVPFIIRKKN